MSTSNESTGTSDPPDSGTPSRTGQAEHDQQAALVAEVGVAMREYQRSLDVFDQRVAEHLGLNRTDMRCLDLILGGRSLSPGELADAAGLTTGGVTTAIDRLERAGYAVRERDAGDRRRVVVRPTDRAWKLAGEVYGSLVQDGEAYLRGLDADTLARLADFLRFATRLEHEHAERLSRKAGGRR
ncbi:MarR family winged helix-turn-helix transcriptional regulator [Plantactinospora siamensis]|uniref:MarR family winged helix-turn-helix transcriptional regulator n=1 Tax=Plantactinospora siamensis TaxID=555372 RepID=A0ABV6P6F2_9ACTN